jgi:hypothetical protein
MGALNSVGPACDIKSLDAYLNRDEMLDQEHDANDELDVDNIDEGLGIRSQPNKGSEIVAALERSNLYHHVGDGAGTSGNTSFGTASPFTEKDRDMLNIHQTLMDQLHSNKRPSINCCTDVGEESMRYNPQRCAHVDPKLSLEQLTAEMNIVNVPSREDAVCSPADELENIIDEWGLCDNPDQE